jgi:hypothetical protein
MERYIYDIKCSIKIEMNDSFYCNLYLGIWDMFDATENLFQEYDKSSKILYSCLITGSLGYTLLLFLIFFERTIQSSRRINKNGQLFSILSEINLFLAYLSITAVWRTYWSVC